MSASRAAMFSSHSSFWKPFFLVAALYDAILGALFFFFYGPLFNAFGIALPNNTSYIHITTAYIFVQGVSYWFVSRAPERNVDIVKVGIVYKAIFSGLAFYYLAIGQLLSGVFVIFAILDLVFLAAFARFVQVTGSEVRAH
jgi:hypothetical protein